MKNWNNKTNFKLPLNNTNPIILRKKLLSLSLEKGHPNLIWWNIGESSFLDNQYSSSIVKPNFIIKRRNHTLPLLIWDPDKIRDGNFGYTKEIELPDKIWWEKGKSVSENLGKIENNNNNTFFSEANDLGRIRRYEENARRLQEIFDTFSPLNSYSLAVMVTQHDYMSPVVKTVDMHYLVNNTTDAVVLLKHIYMRIELLTARYRFTVQDNLIVRYKPLYLKVKDPDLVYPGGRINNTPYKPDSRKMYIKSRFLSPHYIPQTMNPMFYGVVLHKHENSIYFLYNEKFVIKFDVIETNVHHILTIYNYNDKQAKNIDNNILAIVEDVMHDNTLVRAFESGKNLTYVQYGEDSRLINIEYKKVVNFIDIKVKESKRKDKFLTFDIEAYTNDKNEFVPYACGFYDGKNKHLYYVTEFNNNWEEMMIKFISDMMSSKYHSYTAYAHNLGRFDIAFIFMIMQKKYNITNLLSKVDTIISFKASYKHNKKLIWLRFADSYAILPSSLSHLGHSYQVEIKKTVFPYKFVNAHNLSYEGVLPDIKYFEVSQDTVFIYGGLFEYYGNKVWNLKYETLEYLTNDVISLYQILKKADNYYFSNYRINITSYPTLPSISMGILRSSYLNKNVLPKCKSELEQAVRSSFFGGRTEVYKPKGYGLYCYDINSLYPYAMLKDMPVGTPMFSLQKDITKIFGFVKVKINTPFYIDKPVLPCRIPDEFGGSKLIFPLGSWEGWYFSEEVKLAIHYGYQIEVIESFIFERGRDIFKDFIEDFYNQKMLAATAAERNSAKLTMNSLFGRMGMSNERDKIKIVSLKEYNEIELLFDIKAYLELDKKILVRYSKLPSRQKSEQCGKDYDLELLKYSDNEDNIINSSPIAAATASWGRIIMYPYLANAYYSDTDSIFTDYPLSKNILGSEIGKFKLEYGGVIKKAIFPASKLYFLDTNLGVVSKNKGYGGKMTSSDYISLYKGGSVKVTDTRWHTDILNKTVKVVNDQALVITGEYNKRNKIYSKGLWVNTSPVVINSLLQILPTSLIKRDMVKRSMVLYHSPSNRPFLSHVAFSVPPLFLIPITFPCYPLISNSPVITVNKTKCWQININTLCVYVEKIIYESNMLACNEAKMKLYKLTGVMYSSHGDVHCSNDRVKNFIPSATYKKLCKDKVNWGVWQSQAKSKSPRLVYMGSKSWSNKNTESDSDHLRFKFKKYFLSKLGFCEDFWVKHLIKKVLEYFYTIVLSILALTLQFQNLDLDLDSVLYLDVEFSTFNGKYLPDVNLNWDELFDLDYDDYIEEHVEIDIGGLYREYPSWVKDFTNLFIHRNGNSYSLYKAFPNSNSYSGINAYNAEILDKTPLNERPQVLNTILKHHIDSLSEEVTHYKEKYSIAEWRRLKAENMLRDNLSQYNKKD